MRFFGTRQGRATSYAWPGLFLSLLLVLAYPSQASDWGDHDRARQALEAGEILPLSTVLEKLEREMPGRVLEVELEQKHGKWVYEIKLLRNGGALVKMLIDARDGTIVAHREREVKPNHCFGEKHRACSDR